MVIIKALLLAVASLLSSSVSAFTPPSNPPSRSLMSAALSTKGGAASAAAARSAKLAATPSSSAATTHDDSPLMPKALVAMRTCYKTCFVASAVDVTTTLVDKKIRSNLFGVTSLLKLRWTDYVDIFDSLTLLVFALGLQRVSKFYEGWMQSDENRVTNESLSSFFSLMSWMWRVVALNFAVDSLVDASALPKMSIKWLGLQDVSPSSMVAVVTTTLALGYSLINSSCARVAAAEDEKDNNRISSNQSDSKKTPQFISLRTIGYKAFSGQALSAASFGINSCMKLAKWLVAANTGIVGRASSFNEWVEPFAMTALLMGLNKAFLRAAIIRSREESKETAEKDKEIYKDLFNAQIKFYSRVGEFMKGM